MNGTPLTPRLYRRIGGYLVTVLRIAILGASSLILGGSLLASPSPSEQAPDFEQAKAGGVSFFYSARDFAGVKIEKVKKETELGEVGPADGESPEHYCFDLKDRRSLPALEEGPRYFFPANSFVCVFPLHDASVGNFKAAYSSLYSVAKDLRKLLRRHPGDFERWHETTKIDIPDFPYLDAGNSIVSKFQYLTFQSGSGIVFLTQYSNESLPNPVNNEELTLDFQGLTKDGRFYVAARLAVTNPALPRGIDFTDHIKRDPHWKYLENEEKELDGLPDASFRPSLASLKAMLSSLQVQ